MIYKYSINSPQIHLSSDLASSLPLYLYLSSDKQYLLYCNSIEELLNHAEISRPLSVREESISFLLQSGIVPLPHTIYNNIFIVGIGDEAKVETINQQIKVTFSHQFPFKNDLRKKEMEIDEEKIIELLAKASSSTLKENQNSYLFHSAGKDSNMIALALSTLGQQNNITCLTHKSEGTHDESQISKEIAQKLGFKHQTLYSPKKLSSTHLNSIHHYFKNAPLPCVDNVTLAYPLYATQVEFKNSNIIDGSGNDVYIGHIPNKSEYLKQKLFSKLQGLRGITKNLSSDNKLGNITLTKAEWAGLSGFSFGDTKKIFSNANTVYPYWKAEEEKRKNWDYLDIRADIWGSFVESDRVIRKSRNLASIYGANLVLPWCDSEVATYFSQLPQQYLFDKKALKNKLILRKILKEKLQLDSDKLGKMAFSFDFFSILLMMKEEVKQEILTCQLWNKKEIEIILTQLFNTTKHSKNRVLIQRLYLLSAWYNQNRYINSTL